MGGLYGTALRGGFPDELIIVIYDSFQVVGAVVELPQFLVDGSLVVEYIDDELFIDVLA